MGHTSSTSNATKFLPTSSISLDNVKFAYTDSGAPSSSSYTTIFAIHGMGFGAGTFAKIQALAKSSNTRIVAITRRGYSGSTPISETETSALVGGSDEEKAKFLGDRGLEILQFIDKFVQENKIPPATADSKKGGIALLGWSAGVILTLSAIASVDRLEEAALARLAGNLRSVVMYEPASITIGHALPPGTWSPHMDTTIPPELHGSMFTQWITSYFTHGDLTTRDTKVLSFIVPSHEHAPSIYNMTALDRQQITEDVSEMPGMFMSMAQAHAVYRRACFDPAIRDLLPKMKIWELTGDATCSFSLAAYWSIQDDDKAAGGGLVNFKILPGANHFVFWDKPEIFMKDLAEIWA